MSTIQPPTDSTSSQATTETRSYPQMISPDTGPNKLQSTDTTEGVTPEIRETNETMRDIIKFFRDVTILILIVLLIRSFLVTPFRISGQSMEPNYRHGSYILVDKWSYLNFATHFESLKNTEKEGSLINSLLSFLGNLPIHIGDPKRGDAVVIKPHVDKTREYYLKRIIAIPGDTIRITQGNVWIKTAGSEEFIALKEPYLGIHEGNTYLPQNITETDFIIPKDSYWVMGDNRENSADSRSCFINSCLGKNSTHFIKRGDVVGKVLVDFGHFNLFEENNFPKLGKFEWIHTPQFFNTKRSVEYPELMNQ